MVFEKLVGQSYPWLLRFVRRRVADREVAEDILQDALLDAHRSLTAYRGDADLMAWVFGIVNNKIRRHYGNQVIQRHRFVPDGGAVDVMSVDDVDPANIVSQAQRMRHLGAFIEQLETSMKAALCDVSLHGVAYDKVAKQLDIPVGTLRSRLARVRERLRRDLNDVGVGRSD